MIEPGIAFASLDNAVRNTAAFVQHAVSAVLKKCCADLTFLIGMYKKGLLGKLQVLKDIPFGMIACTEAILVSGPSKRLSRI